LNLKKTINKSYPPTLYAKISLTMN